MNDHLPEAVRRGLEEAHKLARRKASRLSLHIGDDRIPVLRHWDTGFAVEAERAPVLRGGIVDLYDGKEHLVRCLVVTSREEAGERVFEYKLDTPPMSHPPADFVRARPEPDGLIEKLS